MKNVLVIGALVLFANEAYAGFYEGKSLVEGLSAYEKIENGKGGPMDYMLASQAIGYVNGIVDRAELEGKMCTPNNSTQKQYMAIVHKYVKANPELWTMPALPLVDIPLTQAFPCKK
jgi:hypothetical protein